MFYEQVIIAYLEYMCLAVQVVVSSVELEQVSSCGSGIHLPSIVAYSNHYIGRTQARQTLKVHHISFHIRTTTISLYWNHSEERVGHCTQLIYIITITITPAATFGMKQFTIIDSIREASLLCAIDNTLICAHI